MQIEVNGKQQTIQPHHTISQLLGDLALDPQRVVVERNREIISRARFSATALEENDKIEILHFVGGG